MPLVISPTRLKLVPSLGHFDSISQGLASAKILILQLTNCSGANQAVPVQKVKRKQVGCLCRAAGDVEFIVKLPCTGYCVTNRDLIPLTIDVQNNSMRVIKMKAKIIQQVTLSVRSYTYVSNKSIHMSKISSEIIQPGASYLWNPTDLIVPPQFPPTLLGCRILHVEYKLEISAVITKALNLKCNIPLFMGNLSSDNLERVLLGAIMSALVQSRPLEATSHCDDVDNDQKQCELSSRSKVI